jgi:hypothetical protein
MVIMVRFSSVWHGTLPALTVPQMAVVVVVQAHSDLRL